MTHHPFPSQHHQRLHTPIGRIWVIFKRLGTFLNDQLAKIGTNGVSGSKVLPLTLVIPSHLLLLFQILLPVRRFSVQLLREAPSPALRACAELAQVRRTLPEMVAPLLFWANAACLRVCKMMSIPVHDAKSAWVCFAQCDTVHIFTYKMLTPHSLDTMVIIPWNQLLVPSGIPTTCT